MSPGSLKEANQPIAVSTKEISNSPRPMVVVNGKIAMRIKLMADCTNTVLSLQHRPVVRERDPKPSFEPPLTKVLSSMNTISTLSFQVLNCPSF